MQLIKRFYEALKAIIVQKTVPLMVLKTVKPYKGIMRNYDEKLNDNTADDALA